MSGKWKNTQFGIEILKGSLQNKFFFKLANAPRFKVSNVVI